MSGVQLPPDSTGKVIETTTVNGMERQVVSLGDATNNELLDGILNALYAIIDKMPLTNRNDAARVEIVDSSFNNPSSGYFGWTTNYIGDAGTGRQIPMLLPSIYNTNAAGQQHIYNNIVVS